MVVESDEIKSSKEEVGVVAVAGTGAETGSSAAVEPSTEATARLGEGGTTGGVPVPRDASASPTVGDAYINISAAECTANIPGRLESGVEATAIGSVWFGGPIP
jgi:hypothetical protein